MLGMLRDCRRVSYVGKIWTAMALSKCHTYAWPQDRETVGPVNPRAVYQYMIFYVSNGFSRGYKTIP